MHKYSLIELLWAMKRGELLYAEYGICYHLAYHCADSAECLLAKNWMQDWPECTGNPSYPVPAPCGGDPASTYDDGLESETQWVGVYGASRKRLLNYLIRRCEAHHAE